MRSRKDACKKLRKKGVIPAAGPVVFNQMDLDKDRFVSESEAARTFKALKHVYNIDKEEMDKVMGKLFKEAGGADLQGAEARVQHRQGGDGQGNGEALQGGGRRAGHHGDAICRGFETPPGARAGAYQGLRSGLGAASLLPHVGGPAREALPQH